MTNNHNNYLKITITFLALNDFMKIFKATVKCCISERTGRKKYLEQQS